MGKRVTVVSVKQNSLSGVPVAQRLSASLTPLDTALVLLRAGVVPIEPMFLPLAEARGCVAADMQPLHAVPAWDMAATDGWAFRANDLVGASSYSPLLVTTSPMWVEAGDRMPDGCDCVLDSDLVDASSKMFQVLGEAIPGQGVRRGGGDIAAGRLIGAGQVIRPLDLLLARSARLVTLAVRRPRLRLVNVPAANGNDTTGCMIYELANAAGASVVHTLATGRDADPIAAALDASSCDLLVTVGGTGVGRSDATVQALAQRGEVLAHGIALQPGRTSAIGKIERVPVIALPGASDQALVAWWMLVLPVLDGLAERLPRQTVTLPLVRKISSGIGITEMILLEKTEAGWLPLASGDLSLDHIARADAWFAVPAGGEGFAAGTPVTAYMLRDET